MKAGGPQTRLRQAEARRRAEAGRRCAAWLAAAALCLSAAALAGRAGARLGFGAAVSAGRVLCCSSVLVWLALAAARACAAPCWIQLAACAPPLGVAWQLEALRAAAEERDRRHQLQCHRQVASARGWAQAPNGPPPRDFLVANLSAELARLALPAAGSGPGGAAPGFRLERFEAPCRGEGVFLRGELPAGSVAAAYIYIYIYICICLFLSLSLSLSLSIHVYI